MVPESQAAAVAVRPVGVASGTGSVIFVQGPQLSASSDSVITPPPAELVLSAQSLMDGLLPDAKVTEGETAVPC